MAVAAKRKLKKNIPGFYEGGLFHPIRSPQYVKTGKGKRKATKADKAKYDRDRAGDNDDIFDREIRKSRNLRKAEENWMRQEENRIKREIYGDADTAAEGKTLVQFVRSQGGIKRTYDKRTGKSYDAGELDGLTFKQSKKRGLVSDNKGKPLDKMFQAAREAGFEVADQNDLLDRLDDEIRGKKATYQTRGYLSYKGNPDRFDVRYTVVKEPDTMRQKGLFSVKRSSTDGKKTGFVVRGVSKKAADEAAHYFNQAMVKLKKQLAKTKKNPSSNGKSAVGRAGTKKRATAKKAAKPRKNGILSSLATAAVGTSAALHVYDRLNKNTKKPTPAASGANSVLRHNKANEAFHEKEFERLLKLIENGDLHLSRSAKLQGKLAGHTPNDIDRAVQYARLTFKLKRNPTPAIVRETETALLKINGLFGRALARHKAGKLYKKQLRLESALERAKKKRAGYEAKAKKNPPKKNTGFEYIQSRTGVLYQKPKNFKENELKSQERIIYSSSRKPAKLFASYQKLHKNPGKTRKNPFDAYESFQGRKSTKTLELPTPQDAPKTLYCLGKLFELRLKGQPNLDFRRQTTGKTFYLCADERNKQLWIAGGTIAAPNNSIKAGFSEPLAPITHVIYETKKVHLDDTKPQGYIHKFGEEGGQQPTLAIDAQGFPIIVGGEYEITPLGIAD